MINTTFEKMEINGNNSNNIYIISNKIKNIYSISNNKSSNSNNINCCNNKNNSNLSTLTNPNPVIVHFALQKGSEYQTTKIMIHLNTGLFSVSCSNGRAILIPTVLELAHSPDNLFLSSKGQLTVD